MLTWSNFNTSVFYHHWPNRTKQQTQQRPHKKLSLNSTWSLSANMTTPNWRVLQFCWLSHCWMTIFAKNGRFLVELTDTTVYAYKLRQTEDKTFSCLAENKFNSLKKHGKNLIMLNTFKIWFRFLMACPDLLITMERVSTDDKPLWLDSDVHAPICLQRFIQLITFTPALSLTACLLRLVNKLRLSVWIHMPSCRCIRSPMYTCHSLSGSKGSCYLTAEKKKLFLHPNLWSQGYLCTH